MLFLCCGDIELPQSPAHTCFEEIQFVPKNGDRRSTDFSSSRR